MLDGLHICRIIGCCQASFNLVKNRESLNKDITCIRYIHVAFWLYSVIAVRTIHCQELSQRMPWVCNSFDWGIQLGYISHMKAYAIFSYITFVWCGRSKDCTLVSMTTINLKRVKGNNGEYCIKQMGANMILRKEQLEEKWGQHASLLFLVIVWSLAPAC